MPQLCYNASSYGLYNSSSENVYSLTTQKAVPQDAPVGTTGQVCVPPTSTFNPATQKVVLKDAWGCPEDKTCIVFDSNTQEITNKTTTNTANRTENSICASTKESQLTISYTGRCSIEGLP